MARFPVIVHKDDGTAYGVTIPDIPGCYAAGDTLDQALADVQGAVEAHLEDAEQRPEPSRLEDLLDHPDAQGGHWVLVDVDLSFLDKRRVRVNISLPRYELNRLDEAAEAAGMNRSEFIVALRRSAQGAG